MPRRKKTPKRDLASIGREVIKEQKAENIVAVSGFVVDEAVQYYDEGWRYGTIVELPSKGLNKGRARVEHYITRRKTWVDGTGLKKLDQPCHECHSIGFHKMSCDSQGVKA